MGLKTGHVTSYSISNITLTSLYNVAFQLYQKKFRCGIDRENYPTIYVDASWVIRSMTCSQQARIPYFLRLCCCLSRSGFKVVVVCDGSERHASKRSTIKRQAEMYFSKITYMKKKCELQHVRHSISTEDSNVRIAELRLEERALVSLTRTLHNKIETEVVDVGNKFYEDLKTGLSELADCDIGSGKISVHQAVFQADTVLSAAIMNDKADILLTNDSDQMALAGPYCILMKKYKFVDKGLNSNVSNIELGFSFKTIFDECIDIMNLPENATKTNIPTQPIFNNMYDIRVRGLIAIILGCDMTLNNFLSLKVLYDYILNLQEEQTPLGLYYGKIIKFAYDNRFKYKKNNLPFDKSISLDEFEHFLNTLVEAYIFEPGNTIEEITTPLYIPQVPPAYLHPYIKEFALMCPDIKINETDSRTDLLHCVGPGKQPHNFLRFEGSNNCKACEKSICKTCTFIGNDNYTYCVNCFATESAVTIETVDSIVPIEVMIQQLHNIGQEVARNDPHEYITKLYEHYIIENNNNMYDEETIQSSIKYPVYNFKQINELTFITEINIQEGGNFICKEEFSNQQRVQILELMSELVTIHSTTDDIPLSLQKLYKVIPNIVIKFAENSRIHNAYRVLRRCIRHASDPLFPSISKARIQIFEHNNEIGMFIKHSVRASMQQQEYNVEVSFTKTDLLCCMCNCRAGGSEHGRSMCVHVLPLLYKLSQLLFEALAEHLLLNVASMLNKIIYGNTKIPLETMSNFYTSIVKLIDATTYNNTKVNEEESISNRIVKVMEQFQVGTEKPKYHSRIVDPSKIGPLCLLKFDSTIRTTSNVIKKVEKKQNDYISDNNISQWEPITSDVYARIKNTLLNFDRYFQTRKNVPVSNMRNELIGYKLIEMRANPLYENEILWKQVDNAISLANSVNRTVGNENTNRKKENIVIDLQKKGNINSRFSEINTTGLKRKIRYCCACTNTSDRNPNLKFTRVPIVSVRPITKNSDTKHRKLHAKSVFKRRTFLERFGILEQINTAGLEYCSIHPINIETVEIPYFDCNGMMSKFETVLKLPDDLQNNKLKTRSESCNIIGTIMPTLDDWLKKSNKSKKENTTTYVNKQKRNGVCDIYHCNHREGEDNTFLTNIPPIPKKVNKRGKNIKNFDLKRYACRQAFRQYCCVSLGIHPNDKRKNLRFCNYHEIKRKNKKVVWYTKNKKCRTVMCTMDLPTANILDDATMLRENKGTAKDRFLIRQGTEALKKKDEGNHEVTTLYVVNQVIEQIDTKDMQQNENKENESYNINKTVAKLFGIDLPKSNLDKLRLEYNGKRSRNNMSENLPDTSTTYQISTMTDAEVYCTTGFRTLPLLISFIVVLNNGDIDEMIKTVSQLTWFEEYILYFERLWGRTITRWIDCENKYRISEKTCRRIFDTKLNLHMKIRKQWLRFASYTEDRELSKNKWKTNYGGKRIIMWDNTDIAIPKPSKAEEQRLTYSAYYGGNVGKGSVFIQPCGWMGTGELWMGTVSDTEYMEKCGILTFQSSYLPKFDRDYDDKKWYIMLDKGYRINTAAFQCGEQKIIQPSFARSDKKFTPNEVLRSAAIAADRAVNERAVRLAKMSGYLNSGLKQNANVHRLMDVWLCWGFQCNFMFRPV